MSKVAKTQKLDWNKKLSFFYLVKYNLEFQVTKNLFRSGKVNKTKKLAALGQNAFFP